MANEWNEAAKRLIELTESGQMRWEQNRDLCRRREKDEEFVGPAYVTEYGGKRIAVYEYRYKQWLDAEKWDWERDVAVEFVDENFESEWTWPAPQRRGALLESIQYQTSHARQFLQAILAEHAPAST